MVLLEAGSDAGLYSYKHDYCYNGQQLLINFQGAALHWPPGMMLRVRPIAHDQCNTDQCPTRQVYSSRRCIVPSLAITLQFTAHCRVTVAFATDL